LINKTTKQQELEGAMNSGLGQQQISPTTVTVASTIGAKIEWYEFFLYGVVTPIVLNKLFLHSY